MNSAKAKKLEKIYYDPKHPASFSTINKLWLASGKKISKKLVTEWLLGQDTYTRHKPRRVHFPRNCYLLNNIMELWEADLIVFPDYYSRHNDGVKYILLVIDCFSKFIFVEPLKRKTTEATIEAFKNIFGRTPIKCDRLATDKGGEFDSIKFRAFMKSNDITYNTTNNPDIKASVAERAVRTIKGKIFKYLTHANTFRYIDVLDDIVESYNDGFHRTIKMAPSEVNEKNILQVYRNTRNSQKLQPKVSRKVEKRAKLKVGDYVRISKSKTVFDKSYLPNYTEELFIVKSIVNRRPVVYYLKDLGEEEIEGTFYEAELQKVKFDEGAARAIEKIIKQRTVGKKLQYLVKWRSYGPKFNSWIDANTVTAI